MADADAQYCTVAQVKSELGITSSSFDTTLDTMVTQASRAIDAFAGRRFYTPTADETRVFDVPTRWTDDILLDFDLFSLTSLTNGEGTAIAATQYQLLPNNSVPKWGVRLRWQSRDTTWGTNSSGDYGGVIQIVGKWGYSNSAPAPIARACVDAVKAWFNTRQTSGIRSQSIDNYSVTFSDVKEGQLPDGVKADLKANGYVRTRLA